MDNINKLCGLLLVLSFSSLAYANDKHAPSWHGVVSAGLTFGGDKLREFAVDTVFSGQETEDIKAGELFFIAGGAAYTHSQFQIQATVGYYADGIFGDNGEATFIRYPIELLGFWRAEHFRLGIGLTHHLSPEFEFDVDDDFLPKEEVDYDDATGLILQGEYMFNNNFGLGIRYTEIEYELSENNNIKADGDSVGLVFTYIFP